MEEKSTKSLHSDAYSLIVNEARGYYFEAYSELDAHENMIRDYDRTMAYKRAILLNKHLFQDKIVLDVGCGLGILSMFAASAGAKLVIGIDASDITVYAEKVIQANHFNNIILINSKVEEITELPTGIDKVDIIISEWMGICLYHESMLATVLYARDRWLKNGGLLFPDKVKLFLGAFDDKEKNNKAITWESIYGLDMKAFQNTVYEEASLDTVNPDTVITDYTLLNEIDLNTASLDFSFSVDYKLTTNKDCTVNGFVTYFDALFTKCHKTVTLSTSPSCPPTHWRHTIFRFRESLWLQKGSTIFGTFSLAPYEYNFRDLAFVIKVGSFNSYTDYKFISHYVLR